MVIYSLYVSDYGGKELRTLVNHFTTREAAEKFGRKVVRLAWFFRKTAYGKGLGIFYIMKYAECMEERFGEMFQEDGYNTTVIETQVYE